MFHLVPQLSSPERERNFLRRLSEYLLLQCLPPCYYNCLPVRTLLRGILACKGEQIMPPPSVMGEVAILFSSSPTKFPLWKACHISFERSLRVHSKIDSVCPTIFKRIAGLCFYPKSLMLDINGLVSTSCTNK